MPPLTRYTMAFDSYSLCPGGRDKKIRFCCNDFLKEIEQIERLLESKQSGACLSYIESIEKNNPDRACLTAAKLSVYRLENRWQDALPLAHSFHEKEPSNPVASAEYALALVTTGQPKAALGILIDAFENAAEGTAHSAVINAMLQVGAALLMYGQVLPVTAIGNQLKNFPSIQEQANALLYRASTVTEVPLLLRDFVFDAACPDIFAGKQEFDDAVTLIRLMRWKSALAKLESLTKHAATWSGIWRDVAAVKLWLLDIEGGKEALKQYASLANTPVDDAADATATLLLLSPDTLGDLTGILDVEYPVKDAEQVHEKLLSASNFFLVNLPPQHSDAPPPKAAFALLDRPMLRNQEVTSANVPTQKAVCILFGKETDREARLIVSGLYEDERFGAEKQLSDVLGDTIQTSGNVLNRRSFTKSIALIRQRFVFAPETKLDFDVVQKLNQEYYETVFIDSWVNLPLGILDGKTPKDAAADAKYKITLLGIIEYLEVYLYAQRNVTDCNGLRQKLGLPLLDKIVIPEGDDALAILDDLPVWRWYRLDVPKVSTDVLSEGLQIAQVMREPRAMELFAKELLERPMNSMPFEARLLAFESLMDTATSAGRFEEALLWLDRGRNESAENNIPDAAWILHEIPLRLQLGHAEKVEQLVTYLTTKYQNDVSVMQALRELYIQLGVLNPDGTPNAALRQAAARQPEEQGSAGLWTPDQAAPASASSTSKLWVPD